MSHNFRRIPITISAFGRQKSVGNAATNDVSVYLRCGTKNNSNFCTGFGASQNSAGVVNSPWLLLGGQRVHSLLVISQMITGPFSSPNICSNFKSLCCSLPLKLLKSVVLHLTPLGRRLPGNLLRINLPRTRNV